MSTQGIIYGENFEDAFVGKPGLDDHQAPAARTIHLNMKPVQNQRAMVINRPAFCERTVMLDTDKRVFALDCDLAQRVPQSCGSKRSTTISSYLTFAKHESKVLSTRRVCNALYEPFFSGWSGSRRQHDDGYSAVWTPQSKAGQTMRKHEDGYSKCETFE